MEHFLIFAKNAFTHDAIEVGLCFNRKDALKKAYEFYKVGIDGEIIVNNKKILEWFHNEPMPK